MIKITSISKIYADALYKFSQDGVLSLDDITADLEKVSLICLSSSELTNTLNNPTVLTETKLQIIEEVFSNDLHSEMKNFLKILVQEKRFQEFDAIKASFQNILDDINNIKRIDIVSAVELTEEKRLAIVEKLQNKLQRNIVPSWIVDKNIIAGLVIKMGDDIIDVSLKNKLENLSKTLILR